jgi:hypothetical protein
LVEATAAAGDKVADVVAEAAVPAVGALETVVSVGVTAVVAVATEVAVGVDPATGNVAGAAAAAAVGDIVSGSVIA